MSQIEFHDLVKHKFQQLQNVKDLANLLQFVHVFEISNQMRPSNLSRFEIKPNVLSYYANILRKGEGYTSFEIQKKNGGKRKISTPHLTLKVIQKSLLTVFSILYEPHKCAQGFIQNKNVATNAAKHIGKKYLLNIDIKDFFPSTNFHKIEFLLSRKPFYLNKNKRPLASLIANLCCKQGVLPQGSPTSPIITNIVCRRIDARLNQLAKSYRAKYSRYADDISFSCNKNIFDDEFMDKIAGILKEDNYEINPQKTRLSKWYQRQEVTGVLVNEKLNLSREYIKDIRYWLFSWEKFGDLNTQMDFEKRFYEKKGFSRYNGTIINFKNYLFGKIQYLNMIRGKEDKIAIRFLKKYELLEKVSTKSKTNLNMSLLNDLQSVRKILEIRGNASIDYSFVQKPVWRNQLSSDNIKMENCGLRYIGDDGMNNESVQALYDFCRYACFQIELLLNIYFKKTYPNWSDLINEISDMKLKGQIRQNYSIYSYSGKVDGLSLATKWNIYKRKNSLLQRIKLDEVYKPPN